ncbi:hypothetical protein EUGRSUZ_J01936 [Eucalyptus grandis]|uniref:Uncharacterized protein n=2 Tax=Eucalyptus grandis TaxID=71139 RepID=A0ACC3J773_EUCGR|nr:hypothetical protein EUGRSUZ_J01936 [Eucalyptus grandis]
MQSSTASVLCESKEAADGFELTEEEILVALFLIDTSRRAANTFSLRCFKSFEDSSLAGTLTQQFPVVAVHHLLPATLTVGLCLCL